MKIALIYDAVYPWMPGGGEKTLYELACHLRDRGHELHFFGMHCWPGPADIVRQGLHYHALCPRMDLYSAARRRLAQPLRFAWGLLARLPRYRLDEFDVIDVHAFPIASLLPFWLVRRLAAPRVPVVVTWLEAWGGGYWREYLGWRGLGGSAVERWAARWDAAHLCISPTTARRLVELLGARAEAVYTIPRGFCPAPAARVQREPWRAVVAGRMRSYKRVELMIRAWPLVLRRFPAAELHILGDGPQRAACQRLAQRLGLSAAVQFRGQLPSPDDVLAELAAATLLLQPSTREGQSTVVLEALSAGTPVLAAEGPLTAVSDFLGPRDEVQQALLPAAADERAWAARIVELFADPALRERLVRAGQAQRAALDWSAAIAPRVEALYRRLCGDEVPAAAPPYEGFAVTSSRVK